MVKLRRLTFPGGISVPAGNPGKWGFSTVLNGRTYGCMKQKYNMWRSCCSKLWKMTYFSGFFSFR
jgi:hypothetical protein